jgi:peptidyl-prolyl cis-trans isomerase D
MLQAIREKAMGFLGWIVIGLIIITFALFGLGSYLQDKTQVFAAKVNDQEITRQELQVAYQRQRARLEQMMGEAFNPSLIDDEALRQRALENLIQQQLLLQAAREYDMVISDELLAAQIQSAPAFQEEGAFSDERYKRLLMQQGQSPARFEYESRNSLQIQQLTSGIAQSAFITPQELNRVYTLQDQKRDFSYLVVVAAQFKETAEVSDEQIQDYFDQNKEQFVIPERVRVSYLRLTGDQLTENIEVDESELEAYYQEKKESLKTQEQRRASHILIQVADDADEETLNKAQAEAEEVLAKLRAGEDFAALAKQHSDDPGSSAQGGDLGFFARGAMVPEFDESVFDMQPGDVSELVRTQFGFHIIKLAEIRGSEIQTLEQARDELIAELKQRSVDDLFYDQLERLTDLSYENPDSLDAAADALGLEVQRSDWLTKDGGPGIGEYGKLMSIIFSEDVLEGGNNSEPVEVGQNDVIVARVEEREAPQQSPLESVKDKIVEVLKQQAAASQARLKGEELLQKLKEGVTMESLKEEGELTFRKAESVDRAAPGHHPEVAAEAFRIPRPEQDVPVEKGFSTNNGNYVVLRLSKVIDPDPASMKDDVRAQLERGYANMRSASMVSAMVEALRARAEIVFPEKQE